ncbi:sugar transferase [bacterium]|nr:sugar transferase [candidate division CSSED10-310 bacterium]
MKWTEWHRHHYRSVMIAFHIIMDFITVCFSFILGYYLYHWLLGLGIAGKRPQPISVYLELTVFVGFLFIFIFERFGLYSLQSSLLNMEELKRMVKAVLTGAMILFTISFYIKRELEWSRLIVSYSLLVTMVMITLQRLMTFKLLQRFQLTRPGNRRLLIYGAGEVGQAIMRRLYQSPRLGMKPVGFIDDAELKRGRIIDAMTGLDGSALEVLGNFEDMQQVIDELDVNEVLIAMPSAPSRRIYQIMKACTDNGIAFSYVPNLFDLQLQKVHFEDLDGVPLLRLKSEHRSFIYLAMKRMFDVAFSSVVLCAALPVTPLLAWLIKRDSRGPVFFVHERVGKDGRLFNIIKFRTMYCDTPEYCHTPTCHDDPRITRVGHWLRRFSIDELPQFWNVIKGEMSVVGPRPEMPFVVDSYNTLQSERLKVRPGITGLWQISADRARDIHSNIDYDIYYTQNQSMLLDLIIILRTIYCAIRGIGAY